MTRRRRWLWIAPVFLAVVALILVLVASRFDEYLQRNLEAKTLQQLVIRQQKRSVLIAEPRGGILNGLSKLEQMNRRVAAWVRLTCSQRKGTVWIGDSQVQTRSYSPWGDITMAQLARRPILEQLIARKEDDMNTATVNRGYSFRDGFSLSFWRNVVFGIIGGLYVASLFVPPLREALAKVFSYFPQ
jgi:hypothetical protein